MKKMEIYKKKRTTTIKYTNENEQEINGKFYA